MSRLFRSLREVQPQQVESVNGEVTGFGFAGYDEEFPLDQREEYLDRYYELTQQHNNAKRRMHIASRVGPVVVVAVAVGVAGFGVKANFVDKPETLSIDSASAMDTTPTPALPTSTALPRSRSSMLIAKNPSTENHTNSRPGMAEILGDVADKNEALANSNARLKVRLGQAQSRLARVLGHSNAQSAQISTLQTGISGLEKQLATKPKVVVKTKTVTVPGPVQTKEIIVADKQCYFLINPTAIRYAKINCDDPKLAESELAENGRVFNVDEAVSVLTDAMKQLLPGENGNGHGNNSQESQPTADPSPENAPTAAPGSGPGPETATPPVDSAPSPAAAAAPETQNKQVTRTVFYANAWGASHTTQNGNKPWGLDGATRATMMAEEVMAQNADIAMFTEFEHVQEKAFMNKTNGKFGIAYAGNDTRNSVAYSKDVYDNVTDEHAALDTFPTVYFDGNKIEMPVVWLKDKTTGRLTISIVTHTPADTKQHHAQEKFRDQATATLNDQVAKLHEKFPDAIILVDGDFNEHAETDNKLMNNAGNNMQSPLPDAISGTANSPIDKLFMLGTGATFTDYNVIRGAKVTKITDHARLYTAQVTY